MNKLFIYTLKSLRKGFSFIIKANEVSLKCEENPEKASIIIFNALISDKPCMIARFGAFELGTFTNYLGVKLGKRNILSYIKGNELDWWWNESLIKSMHTNAGFFPATKEKIEQFCNLMMQDIPIVDILGSWLHNEKNVESYLKDVKMIYLLLLDPYWSKTPWTKALEGKKVLVVHPFADTIEQQYKKREFLFNDNLLPEFQLKTIKAVQSIAGEKCVFSDWFEALESMKTKIDNEEYDICLIGCGAYGFHLAAHVKRKGKKAVHIGGSLQLLFGIRGNRWEDENYNDVYNYSKLMNKYWVKPNDNEKPIGSDNVEGSCYW
jgi:hypothetical protein